jgi:hypothetical protein
MQGKGEKIWKKGVLGGKNANFNGMAVSIF